MCRQSSDCRFLGTMCSFYGHTVAYCLWGHAKYTHHIWMHWCRPRPEMKLPIIWDWSSGNRYYYISVYIDEARSIEKLQTHDIWWVNQHSTVLRSERSLKVEKTSCDSEYRIVELLKYKFIPSSFQYYVYQHKTVSFHGRLVSFNCQ